MQDLILKVYAQTAGTDPFLPTGWDTESTFGGLMDFIVNAIMIVGTGLVIVMLALGFMMYITSRGDKTAVENAQKWLTYAAIGGVGLLFVYVLRGIIYSLLDINTDELMEE